MYYEKKRTWAEIKLTGLQYNIKKLKLAVGETCKVMAVVKANAYGHGGVQIAKSSAMFGCDWFGVATLNEARELRDGGIKQPILIMSHTTSEFIEQVVELDCVQALGSLEDAKAYSSVLGKKNLTLRVHVKLDSGMGRTGFDIKRGDISGILSALKQPGISAEGIFTHLAVADDPSRRDFTLRQIDLFNKAVAKIEEEAHIKFAMKHCANSAAMISFPESHMDMVRVGISLYGVYPSKEHGSLSLTPVMELKSRIIQLKELEPGDTVSYGQTFTAEKKMRVAVLPVGYADGLHRNLSNKIDIIVHDKRCPQVGTICMDMCMVDVSDVPDVAIDDIATVFGHEKESVIHIDELAEKAGTISYELLCAVSPRVDRTYRT